MLHIRELTTKWFLIVSFSLDFQFITYLLDWPANIVAGLNSVSVLLVQYQLGIRLFLFSGSVTTICVN